MREVSLDELIAMLPDDGEDGAAWRHAITVTASREGAEFVALFRNDLMDSSHFGDVQIMVGGPFCTYKAPADLEGHHLGDVPSRFMYPVAWAPFGEPGWATRLHEANAFPGKVE